MGSLGERAREGIVYQKKVDERERDEGKQTEWKNREDSIKIEGSCKRTRKEERK